MSATKTHLLKLPDAMPVRTIAVDVVGGADAGARWEGEEVTVGTGKANALCLADETVSGYHVRIAATADGIRVTDLGSTNGTFAGEIRVTDAIVPPATTLRLGRTTIALGKGLPTTVELHDEDHLGPLRGRTQAMRRLMSQVRRAAQSHVAVLLIGESGTGKELVARALHDASPRKERPFITIDCASITPNLIASELFGHEKGAFTGATQTKVGAFEEADGGTVFLDEIGELPLDLQTALLGVLERKRFSRVGGRKEITVDIRVVAATHRDLRASVNSGQFRLDLYYRLAVVTLPVPALRERDSDIPLLVEHFARDEGVTRPIEEIFPEETMAELRRYRWPGNVRELRNFVQATIAMGEAALPTAIGDDETSNDPDQLRRALASLVGRPYGEARTALLEEFELCYLTELIKRSDGNVARAARDGRIARSHLNDLLKRHRLC